jgi:hypothetical protein
MLRMCAHLHECVTLLQHMTCFFLTKGQYNTVELCMCLHTNSVYYVSYSFLRYKGISTKIKSILFEMVEITSSKIQTCSHDLWITKWLYTNNSYLALLTRSCKLDCHMGLKNSMWHYFNHDQDTGWKGISRKDATLLNWIGWCQFFSVTFSWIHFWNFWPMSGIWIYMSKMAWNRNCDHKKNPM